jgi:hypothetical protein
VSDDDRFEQFMEKVMQRSLPHNPMARVRMLAKELAEGALDHVWDEYILVIPSESHYGKFKPESPALRQ